MTKDRQNMQHRYIELFYDGQGSGGPGRGGGGGYGSGGGNKINLLFVFCHVAHNTLIFKQSPC